MEVNQILDIYKQLNKEGKNTVTEFAEFLLSKQAVNLALSSIHESNNDNIEE